MTERERVILRAAERAKLPGVAAGGADRFSGGTGGRPVVGQLAAVTDELELLKDRQRDLVVRARREGASWGAIGAALGVSPQAAHERFRRHV